MLSDDMIGPNADLAPATERLSAYAAKWNVVLDSVRTTETSLLGYGKRADTAVILKITRARGEEWWAPEFLAAAAGRGTVTVLEHEPGALLMPQLSPGDTLSSLSMAGRDDEAASILCRFIGQFETVPLSSVPLGIQRAEDLWSGFQRYRSRAANLYPDLVVDRAAATFLELTASQRSVYVSNADLHHYNVLFDINSGWTVIDPQPIIAEREYELGAILRNPIEAPDLLARTDVLEKRLKIFERDAGIDSQRALKWSFAQAVLATLWPIEEGVGVDLSKPFQAFVSTALQLM